MLRHRGTQPIQVARLSSLQKPAPQPARMPLPIARIRFLYGIPDLLSLVLFTRDAMLMGLGPKTPSAPASPPPRPPTPTAAAGHGELRLPQRSPAVGCDHGIKFPADLRHDADARLFQRRHQPQGNRPADHQPNAQLAKTAHNSLWLFLKQHHFPALRLGSALQADQHEPRRHVEYWRYPALTVGNCNQHASGNARFMPAPARRLNCAVSPLKSGPGAAIGPDHARVK